MSQPGQEMWVGSPDEPGALADYAGCMGDGHDARGQIDLYDFSTVIKIGKADGTILHLYPYDHATDCGPAPRWRYHGHDLALGLKKITDGTSKTFLFGEKHVPTDKFGLLWHWSRRTGLSELIGDNSIYNADVHATVCRFAGTGYPLALSPEEPVNVNFGSYHPGICNFVFADGHVQAVATNVDTAALDRLANRHDGLVIPGEIFR